MLACHTGLNFVTSELGIKGNVQLGQLWTWGGGMDHSHKDVLVIGRIKNGQRLQRQGDYGRECQPCIGL